MKYILLLLLNLLSLVRSELSLVATPLYDFANGCPGLINLGLPAFVCKQDSYGGDVFVISSLTHQVLKLSENEDGDFICSVYGYLPPGSGGVSIGSSFSFGMDIDPSGNIYISNTGSGPASGDYGSVWKISSDSATVPIQAVKIYTAPTSAMFGLPSGITVVWRKGFLLLSSETDGTIYKIALDGSYSSIWASASNSKYSVLAGVSGIPGYGGTIDNTNLFGAPFGPVASDISTNGKILYVGSAERGLICSIEINEYEGSAGDLVVVGSSPEHTIEGLYYDNSAKKVYFGSVFRNGSNLTPNGPNGEYNGGLLSGNSLWTTDLKDGSSSRFYDERLGSVCSVNKAHGILPQGQKKLLVITSGFDFLPAWPLGLVRAGLAPYPTGPVNGSTTGPALPGIAYNAKIWVVNTA